MVRGSRDGDVSEGAMEEEMDGEVVVRRRWKYVHVCWRMV